MQALLSGEVEVEKGRGSRVCLGHAGNEAVGADAPGVFRFNHSHRAFPTEDIVEDQVAGVDVVDTFGTEVFGGDCGLVEGAFTERADTQLRVAFACFHADRAAYLGRDFGQWFPFCVGADFGVVAIQDAAQFGFKFPLRLADDLDAAGLCLDSSSYALLLRRGGDRNVNLTRSTLG